MCTRHGDPAPRWLLRARTLSGFGFAAIEVFIGSRMTNSGHFRAAAKLLEGKRDMPMRLWVTLPN